jgi:type I restriction enzyme S subunit
MFRLTFRQTNSELMVRAAATVLFSALSRRNTRQLSIAQLAERPLYGFTASAATQPIGPKLVRITDLQDGKIEWDSVPFCQCSDPENYILHENDILFARTGATTGKTHLVRSPQRAIFASYLIRLRPKPNVDAGYLYSFFQSDNYWLQISEQKEGSAQPNVNGAKLTSIKVPFVQPEFQRAIGEFVNCVRRRQDGDLIELPELPPPLVEQRNVVARVEELVARVQEVCSLRDQISREMEALCRSILASDLEAKPTPMQELVRLRSPDVFVLPDQDYQFAGVFCFGRGVFRSQLKRGIAFAYPRLTRLRAGDFVYPKLMAWEGAFGVVPTGCDGCVVSTEFPVFEILQDKVLPEVLETYFRNPAIWPEVAGVSTGTNVRRRRLNPQDFLEYKIPLPSRRVQERLRQVKAEIETIKRIQAGSQTELDALLPAILDRASSGEF